MLWVKFERLPLYLQELRNKKGKKKQVKTAAEKSDSEGSEAESKLD
jgi:hypothetical protein